MAGDAAEEARNFISRFLGDVGKSDTTKQIVLGAGSGWITGYLAMRVAKTTAMAIGGGIILLQVATDRGLVNVNWSKLNKKAKKVADQVETELGNQDMSWSDKVVEFLNKNTPFSSGFVGGFFIGMAT